MLFENHSIKKKLTFGLACYKLLFFYILKIKPTIVKAKENRSFENQTLHHYF